MTRDQAGTGLTLGPHAPGAAADTQTMMIAAKAADENFPVALRLLPGRYRRHLMAVYCYARAVDDAGDLAPPGERGRLLAELEEDLTRLYAAQAAPAPAAGQSAAEAGQAAARAGPPRSPAVAGLSATVADCGIPMQPFLDLIRANQQDQVVTRYETFQELVGYCELSANPVGRIVLHVFGCYTAQRALLSDDICTGLQLAEHLQDVAEDMRAGRVYLPAADLRRFDCSEQDLVASQASPRLRRLIEFEAARARRLIDSGAGLVGTLHGAPRAAVAGYVAGGRAALAAIAAADYEVLAATRRPAKTRMMCELVTALVRGR